MKNNIIDSLIEIGAVKFGEFTLKSGQISPIYIDLRIIVSFPQLLKDIATEIIKKTQEVGIDCQRVAGIPYTGLPMATAISLEADIPMVYARKEAKNYGTAKLIEGCYEKGDNVLVIDDLITSGDSKFETFTPFEQDGLIVSDVIVLIDREQGGAKKLELRGYQLHSIISIYDILERLKNLDQISQEKYEEIMIFLKESAQATSMD